jgi:CRISPR-associated protein Cmr4
MYQIAKPLVFLCETPLHAGKGDDLGIVDLPIQREKHTDFPKIEGSSLKGAIREAFESREMKISLGDQKDVMVEKGKTLNLVFGDPDKGDEHASALGFSDARILLFPVKSLKGVFTWVTCPEILNRFKEEIKEVCQMDTTALDSFNFWSLIHQVADEHLLINGRVLLEEFGIPVQKTPEVQSLAQYLADFTGVPEVARKLVVLDNDTFTYFVKYATEVITRIKIGTNGTVEAGPFNEEYLPTESILYAHITSSPLFVDDKKKDVFALSDEEIEAGFSEAAKIMHYFHKGLPDIIQVGANATLAKGLIKTIKKHF